MSQTPRTSIDRRAFMTGAAASGIVTPAIVQIPRPAKAQSMPRIRYDIETPEGAKMLERLSKAIAHMKTKAHHEPRSWRFWANTHWIVRRPGQSISQFLDEKFDLDQGTTPEEKARIAAHRELAWKNDMERIWATCEHGTDHFVTWHRMYLHYFERTVQAVLVEELNDADPAPFAIPYWDFTKDDAGKRQVPQQFRALGNNGDQQSNPLWYTDREPDFNRVTGATGLSDFDVDITSAMKQRDLLVTSEDEGFSRDLDGNAHGNIHVAVGAPFAGLSSPPAAARDPVFYPFHANTDRLWESWRNPLGQAGPTGRDPIDQAWLDKGFAFATPDGTRESKTNGEILDMRNLNFTYDRLEPLPPVVFAAARPQDKAFGIGFNQSILAQVDAQGVALSVSKAEASASLAPTAAGRAKARDFQVAGPPRYILVLDDVMTSHNAGEQYDVFLSFPDTSEDRLHVGRFNFFNLMAEEEDLHARHGAHSTYFVYDVTEAVSRISPGSEALLTPKVMVSPVKGVDRADVKIARIQLLQR